MSHSQLYLGTSSVTGKTLVGCCDSLGLKHEVISRVAAIKLHVYYPRSRGSSAQWLLSRCGFPGVALPCGQHSLVLPRETA